MSFEIPDQTEAVHRIFNEHFDPDPAVKTIDPATLPNVSDDERAKRCEAYIERCPEAISKQNGHNAMLRVACETFRFAMTDADRWAIVRRFNARCLPPFSEAELAHKIESAATHTAAEIGIRLATPNPWRARVSGDDVWQTEIKEASK